MASADARFGELTNEKELDLLVEERHSKSTKSVFKVSENLLRAYTETDSAYSVEQLCDGEVVSVVDLDCYLRRFFVNARKQNGERYCRKSMLTIRFGLQKFFNKKREVDIINDDRFLKSRDAFKAVLVTLKQEGKGDSKHKDIISEADIEKMYNSDVFSVSAPKTLQNKVFFDYMLHFCNRGRENLRTLRKDDFDMQTDATGRRFITMKSKLTKNRREDDDDFTGSNRIYEDKGNPRCPVVSFEQYLSKLHPESDAFFQRPAAKISSEEVLPWFTKQPLGHNKLSGMMSEISKMAKLSKVYTNHCVRATCITLLDNNGFESRHIIGISKHKSESSLKHYSSKLSEEKRIKASDILTSACTGTHGTGKKDNTDSGEHCKHVHGNELQPIDTNLPAAADIQLMEFLSSSQEDYLYASLDDTDFHMKATTRVMHSASTSQSVSAGRPTSNAHCCTNTQMSHSSTNLGVYNAPLQHDNVPFNLTNYGTVNIVYNK